MKNILFCGYRDWAIDVFKQISKDTKFNFILLNNPSLLSSAVNTVKPDIIFFIGWSWMVDTEITKNYLCLCMHPSLLPKYKGGSPIQNQVISGETCGGITFFRMNDKVDSGDICYQTGISLDGYLDDILELIKNSTIHGINYILNRGVVFEPQVGEESYFSRRKPEESEIKTEDFSCFYAKELYDKIRCLQKPYPQAYITCKDGTKLIIEKATIE